MVRILFLCAVAFGISQSIVAQTFLEVGTEWNYNLRYFNRAGVGVNTNTITGDTTINNKTFLILRQTDSNCNLRPIENYIHVDGKRVYYYDNPADSFQLLYDFTAQAGDTLQLPYWEYISDREFFNMRIDSVDTFAYDTFNLVRQYVTYDHYDQGYVLPGVLIEGIGSTTNFFHFYDDGLCDFQYSDVLRCFEKPGYDRVQLTGTDCDFKSSSTYSVAGYELTISPNPTSDYVTISSDATFADASLVVYDLVGRELQRVKIAAGSPLNEQVDLSNYMPGQYVLQLYDRTADVAPLVNEIIVKRK